MILKPKRAKPSIDKQPPKGRTPPKANGVTPPSRHRERLLPIVDIGSENFEHLCCDLLKQLKGVRRRALKRKKGLPQYGVDAEGFNDQEEPFIVVSCKCYHNILPSYVVPWVKEFTDKYYEHWSSKRVEKYILAVTTQSNCDKLNSAVRTASKLVTDLGMEFELWDSLQLTDLLRNDTALVDRYFQRYWVEAISAAPSSPAPEVAAATAAGAGSAALISLARELAEVTELLDREANERIDSAFADFQAGSPGELRKCLDGLQHPSSWDKLSPGIRARVLRARAILAINADDLETAEALEQFPINLYHSRRP